MARGQNRGYKRAKSKRTKTDQRRRDVGCQRCQKDETSKITTYAITVDCGSHLNTAHSPRSLVSLLMKATFSFPRCSSPHFSSPTLARPSLLGLLPFSFSRSLPPFSPCVATSIAFFAQDDGTKNMARSECYHRTARCSLKGNERVGLNRLSSIIKTCTALAFRRLYIQIYVQ